MGIRYYAHPVQPGFEATARDDPLEYLRGDDFHCFSVHREPVPPTLDLDKGWRDFQHLFGGPPGGSARPALDLVRGDVIQSCCGWISFFAFRDSVVVREIADDLESLDYAESARDDPYLVELLTRARLFTRSLAVEGMSLIYSIG